MRPAAAVGGSFASRLNARLREQLGYTYGISSTFWRAQWGGAWNASSSIRTDVTAAGVQEILTILRATMSKPLPADELKKTKALITRALPQEFETNASIAGAFSSLVLENRPLTDYRDRTRAIEKVTAAACTVEPRITAKARVHSVWKMSAAAPESRLATASSRSRRGSLISSRRTNRRARAAG